MSFTSLPTRGPTDLQGAITDVRAPVANELSADSIEAIKDRIIEIGTALGIDAGTGAGSVRRGYLPTLLQLAGDITPTALAANANDYAPTGSADASVWYLSATGAARTITGIAGGADGRILLLVNTGSLDIYLPSQNAGSAAANRLATLGNVAVPLYASGGVAVLIYSAGLSRWIPVAIPARARLETATAPGVTDDASKGFRPGSLWIDLATQIYFCADATVGAALWFSLALATRTISTTAPLTGGGDLSANRTLAIDAATTSAVGAVELATTAETQTGTDTARAVTPKALADTLQPAGRTVSGTTDTIVAGDIGALVLYSQAGGVTVDLASLASSLISGRALVLTLQGTNAATVITVDPGTSVTIDGSASNYVAATGKARVSLLSLDGLAWYSGTP